MQFVPAFSLSQPPPHFTSHLLSSLLSHRQHLLVLSVFSLVLSNLAYILSSSSSKPNKTLIMALIWHLLLTPYFFCTCGLCVHSLPDVCKEQRSSACCFCIFTRAYHQSLADHTIRTSITNIKNSFVVKYLSAHRRDQSWDTHNIFHLCCIHLAPLLNPCLSLQTPRL